jgi:hypothetical protein
MFTQTASNNKLQLGFGRFIIRFSDFDLSHVNEIQHKSKPVHGIIGADVLREKRLWIMQIIFCIYSKTYCLRT